MKERSHFQPPGVSADGKAYADVFVRRVHTLLALGYATLTPADFISAEEEHITGELVDAVQEILDDSDTPAWADSYSIHEEPREHHPTRKLKKHRSRAQLKTEKMHL